MASRGVADGANFVFGYTEAAKVFEWKIDTAFAVVSADVLPEVRELQSRAGVVGKLLTFWVAVSAQIQDQVSDWIRRVSAIGEQV